MINLLSPQDKKELRAARLNVLLRRYNLLVLLTLVGVAAVFMSAIIFAYSQTAIARGDIERDQQDSSQYTEVQQEAEQFENNLTIAKRILADEIIYSKVITDIAGILPSNVRLNNLTLNPDTFDNPSVLDARTTGYDAALNLKTTLEDSNIFQDVSIANIARAGEGNPDVQADNQFPYGVTLNVTLVKPEATGSRE